MWRAKRMKFKKFVSATWELPQNVLGAIAVKLYKAKYMETYNGAKVYTWHKLGGLSLGNHIFICGPLFHTSYGKVMLKHEYGHTRQSKRLGWFYLLVIGIPSFLCANWWQKHREKKGKSYYTFYTEAWADKLGGVERDVK